jgi:hypothetical protein
LGKLETADGRIEYIYAPIRGFEHLFDASSCSQESPSSRHSVAAVSHPQQSQALGETALSFITRHPLTAITASTQDIVHNESQQRSSKQSYEPATSLGQQPEQKRQALKRSRSVAQGLSQSRRAREVSDVEDNIDHADDEKEEVAVVNEASKTFQVGDIEALKTFLRARIDELTMKPVRSMVTSWVKKLEPKRKGGYGPYHKMLPSAAPEEATPPWWPRTVPYIEPAHLDKDGKQSVYAMRFTHSRLLGLITLAIDIILQHRDIAIDELKRQKPWAYQLQRVAEFEVSMLPAEQYSSSRNATFSTAMKDRAEKEILPSLFDVVQSYEDHVFQYNLWTYKDIKEAPKGKTITWQLIPRPIKQVNRAKRVRRAVQPKLEPKEVVLDYEDESSGNETVPDETMLKLANKIIRYEEAKAARRKARAAAAQARLTDQVSSKQNVEASTPTVAESKSEPATPQVQQSIESQNAQPAASSSFDQSMDHLCLQEKAQGPSPVPKSPSQPAQSVKQSLEQPMQCHTPHVSFANGTSQHEQDDVKVGRFMPSGQQAQQPHMEGQLLDVTMHYHNAPPSYANHTFRPTEDDDVKGGSAMVHGGEVQQSLNGMQSLVDAMQYHNRHAGYGSDTLQPLQGMGSFADAGPPHYTQFAAHNYINPSDLALFNNCFPVHMGHSSYEAAMAASNMDYTYSSEELFTPMGVTASSAPTQTGSSFNGLPYNLVEPRH